MRVIKRSGGKTGSVSASNRQIGTGSPTRSLCAGTAKWTFRVWWRNFCRYDMLMLFVEENGFHGMPPNCGGETGTATKINEIGG